MANAELGHEGDVTRNDTVFVTGANAKQREKRTVSPRDKGGIHSCRSRLSKYLLPLLPYNNFL